MSTLGPGCPTCRQRERCSTPAQSPRKHLSMTRAPGELTYSELGPMKSVGLYSLEQRTMLAYGIWYKASELHRMDSPAFRSARTYAVVTVSACLKFFEVVKASFEKATGRDRSFLTQNSFSKRMLHAIHACITHFHPPLLLWKDTLSSV